MTSTREHHNAGMFEDAVASVGTAITVLEHMRTALGPNLPDDYPSAMAMQFIENLRTTHDALTSELGI